MEKTKIEQFSETNGLTVEINVYDGVSYVALYRKTDLYVKFYNDKSLACAINKAVNNWRIKNGSTKTSS